MMKNTTPIQYFVLSNDEIASVFEQVADLLEIQEENYYRIRAYREAAQTIRSLERSVKNILQLEGRAGLEKLPHIGQHLSLSIEELLQTGELSLLKQLLVDISPEDVFKLIPGIGDVLAHRVQQELGIETLEELELAAHTGKLDAVPGFGSGRTRLVRDALETILNRSSRQRIRVNRWREIQAAYTRPPIALILDIDAEYRHLAAAGQLPVITPRRFNPTGKRWLPIMHVERDGWWFSALYSNTARAHELGKTHDWVVIYYERNGHQGQCTVVTETRGEQRGQRVVRG
ncbi:Helix-hairpin-helix DNA-binding protein [Leptolyngbya sp. PCC 7375]|nr:Helix-hairpin-helix DNA-binding protein [Leptolyngbya sp. PCC 7375]